MFGGLDTPEADGVGKALAAEGITVLTVDYQLAPMPRIYTRLGVPARHGVHFPVASEEVGAVLQWALTAGEVEVRRWSLGGASAGGALAAGAVLRARDRLLPMPHSLVLVYALLHAEPLPLTDELSRKVDALPKGDLEFGPELLRELVTNYVGHKDRLSDPYAFPGGHDLRGLPPVFVLNADSDGMRSSGEAFTAELAAAGVDVLQIREDGSEHGYLADMSLPASGQSIRRISAWLRSDDLVGRSHEPAVPPQICERSIDVPTS